MSGKEYEDFLFSEFVIQKMQEENLSVRALAKKASVSPTVIQKIRNPKSADKITYKRCLPTFGSTSKKQAVNADGAGTA